jgi:hypothetical protein
MNRDQTQCTRAAYEALAAGGVDFSTSSTFASTLPEQFGKTLQALSKSANSGVREILYSK